jgi:hypothetical protein
MAGIFIIKLLMFCIFTFLFIGFTHQSGSPLAAEPADGQQSGAGGQAK